MLRKAAAPLSAERKREKMTFKELFKERLHEMILELADDIAEMELEDDEAAGIPMLLFRTENVILAAVDDMMAGR